MCIDGLYSRALIQGYYPSYIKLYDPPCASPIHTALGSVKVKRRSLKTLFLPDTSH